MLGLDGIDGIDGTNGIDGEDGDDGAPGANGRTILNGSGTPANGVGADGDFYIDTAAARRNLYGPKAGGVWGASVPLMGLDGTNGIDGEDGDPGDPGADGRTILNGADAPTVGIGADGDFYLRTTDTTLYGPKTGGAWGSPVSLIGEGASGGLIAPVTIVAAQSPYTLLDTQRTVLADCTNGPITVIPPNPIGRAGKEWTIKKLDATTNPVTIDPAGAVTIDGLLSVETVNSKDAVTFESDDVAYQITSSPTALIDAIEEADGFPNKYKIRDHFIIGSTSTGFVGELSWAWTGGTFAPIASSTTHPRLGLFRRDTGTTINTVATAQPRNSSNAFMLPSFMFDMKVCLKLNQVDALTLLRIGFTDSVSSLAPNNAFYIQKAMAGTEYFPVGRAGSAETIGGTALGTVTTDFEIFRIRRIDASTIGFTVGENVERTMTTGIPTNPLVFVILMQTGEAASKTYDIDWFSLLVEDVLA
jgi:hypothetical protein